MGTIKGKFIRGLVGAVIFKEHRGQQVVQGRSEKKFIDMTPASYDAAFIFGRASTLASCIRHGTNSLVAFYDGGMISRFTGECNLVLQKAAGPEGKSFNFDPDAFSRLNGFEFNNSSLVRNQLFIQPMVSFADGKLYIDFPEMKLPGDLKFPSLTGFCALGMNVTQFDLQHGTYLIQPVQVYDMELTIPGRQLPAKRFEFNADPGCLCIVGISLQYYEKTFAGNAVLNTKSFSPAAILKACFAPGEISEKQTGHELRNIHFNKRKKHKAVTAAKKKALKPD